MCKARLQEDALEGDVLIGAIVKHCLPALERWAIRFAECFEKHLRWDLPFSEKVWAETLGTLILEP